MTATDSIAIMTPKAASSLALLWEKEGEFVGIMLSDGGVEIDGVGVAEEPTKADGSAELDDFSAGVDAELVVLAKNVSMSTCWGNISNIPKNMIPRPCTSRGSRRRNLCFKVRCRYRWLDKGYRTYVA